MSVELLSILNTLQSMEPLDQVPLKDRIKIEAEISKQLVIGLSFNKHPDLQFFKQLPADILLLVSNAFRDDRLEEPTGWISKLKEFWIKYTDQEKYKALLAQFLYERYSTDEEFSNWILDQAQYIVGLYQSGNGHGFNQGLFESKKILSDMAHRCLLIELSRRWDRANNEQPILWKVSECLQEIAFRCDGKALVQVTNVLIIHGLQKVIASHEKHPVDKFLALANEDKNGNIIDNLVVSMQAYNLLLETGWEPDRWEVENLQMTVDLLLQYIEKEGFSYVENIDNELIIGLDESLKNYRYSGSPFINKNDQKCVKVVAPGLKIQDRQVIRPKVREIE